MKIISIVEFGSSARMDNDEFSDKDYFLWVEKWEDRSKIIQNVKNEFSFLNNNKCEFIIHDTNSFDFMLDKGSLFLWHLKLEAKPVYGKHDFLAKLSKLEQFTRYTYKFENYINVFYDLKEARTQLPQITSFDYATMFTVIRNLCILVCFKIGSPKFGRTSAFLEVFNQFEKLSINKEDYDFLLNKKLEYERGFILDSSDNSIDDLDIWITKVDAFSSRIKTILKIG